MVVILALLFLSALAVGFSGALMPGSLLTYTIRQAMSIGPRAGFIVTTGHVLLELILIVLIFLGFGNVLQSGTAQIAIGLIGGAFLAYMGYGMISGAVRNTVKVQTDETGTMTKNVLFSGLIISAANPYFLLWWAIIGLGFIMQSFNTFGLAGVALYFVGHVCADYIWYGFVSTVVGTTKKFIKEKPYRVIIALLGVLLVFFGGRFIYSAIAKVAF
jgi:threonine/homoserine/homoserine lactone efflux protein